MEAVQSNLLNKVLSIRHAFFRPGLEGGVEDNLSFKNGTTGQVCGARQRACGLIGVRSEDIVNLIQVHGTTVWRIGGQDCGCGASCSESQLGEGDALITDEASVPLTVTVSDCIPVFFSSPDAKVIGLAHAGWRSTLDNISVEMIRSFAVEYSVEPAALLVWIGPGISSCCFQVKTDVWEPFQQTWGHLADCFDAEKMTIDLKQINRAQLLQAGVLESNLEISPDCTCCDRNYFSFRRDGAGIGHNLALIQKG